MPTRIADIDPEKGLVRNLDIDYLYLDMTSCSRSMLGSAALDEALKECAPVLKTLGYRVRARRVNISTVFLAEYFNFSSSPTILVNGIDIFHSAQEEFCPDCSRVGNVDMRCRVFDHNGIRYDHPTKALISDGIFRAIYGKQPRRSNGDYSVPESIISFFRGKAKRKCGSGAGVVDVKTF